MTCLDDHATPVTASVKNLLYQLSHGESCRNYMYSVHLEQNSSAVKINHEKKHHYGPIDLVHCKWMGHV